MRGDTDMTEPVRLWSGENGYMRGDDDLNVLNII